MELEVPPDRAGERLDAFLSGAVGSRSQAQRLIEAGRVRVDGAVRAKRHALSGGERVTVAPAPPAAEGVAPPQIQTRYEDQHLLVVEKPAGLAVHAGAGAPQATLVDALAGRVGGGDEGRSGIVHRLDKDTSGLMIVARTEQAHAALSALIAERGVQRDYLALVDGVPPTLRGTIDAPIGRDRRERTRHSTQTDSPREASTDFELEQAFVDAALLRVRLRTGRTHQIRVHLQAIGHPVCGDRVYGRVARFGLRRQFLHAARLAFAHPITGATIELDSELPEDLADALHRAAES